MKSEQLKKIAEYMGKTFQENRGDNIYIKHAGFQHGFPYRPDEDNDQLIELIEKLIHLHNLNIRGGFAGTDTLIYDRENNWIAEGKTLAEAVCNAIIQIIDDSNE